VSNTRTYWPVLNLICCCAFLSHDLPHTRQRASRVTMAQRSINSNYYLTSYLSVPQPWRSDDDSFIERHSGVVESRARTISECSSRYVRRRPDIPETAFKPAIALPVRPDLNQIDWSPITMEQLQKTKSVALAARRRIQSTLNWLTRSTSVAPLS
jgi:hypothetical protein